MRDFEPVTQALAQSNVLLVNPGVPVKNVRELVALAKVNPGQLNYASSGVTTILQRPDVKRRLLNDGAEPVGSNPAQFKAFLESELTKWTQVAKEAGIRAD